MTEAIKPPSNLRVTEQAVDESILRDQYHVFALSTHTICLLTLRNGFTVTGESACIDPTNFDIDIGRQLAYADARRKVWGYLAYSMKEAMTP